VKFLCEQCKAKYQIADEKVAGKTVRMKCRKCGHLIEVRAAVTETSTASPQPHPERHSGLPAPILPQRSPSGGMVAAQLPESRPRAAPLATGFALGTRTAPRHERSAGALEGAFKNAVQREDESSAPFDMSDLSPSDEWYVAINGVPVGPIRVAEVRRKAALGAVTEDSLVWQEGLDEWRPLRLFPELAASVREAMSRLSRPPSSEMRSSTPPPPPTRSSARPSVASGGRIPPPRAPPAPLQRNNVVPIMSRLATAERLDEPVQERPNFLQSPQPPHAEPVRPSVVPDPFASPSVAQPPAPASVAAAPAFRSISPFAKKSPPWMALAMIAAAVAFGVTAGVMFMVRPASPAPAPSAAPPNAAPIAVAPVPSAIATAPANADSPEPVSAPAPTAMLKGPAAAGPKANPAAPAANPGRSLDLHSLAQNASNIAPVDESGGDSPKAAGQCFSEGQVQQIIGLHQVGIRRACWERNPTTKPTVNVGVSMTIGPDGSAQSVTTTGDEPSVSKCIENDVRGWRFPAMGCTQKTNFSFKFVRQ
jgi:predicted Zn finger-like uncharacterized protein